MDEIKVSVITYVKNDVKHIEKCLKSVLNQTLKEIELIIVDGGSTDGTIDIIDRIARSDQRVRILTADVGVGKQFNTGLKAAKGKYIGICESDDFLKPEMYEKQYGIAEKYNLDYVLADYNCIYEINGVIYSFVQNIYPDPEIYGKVICPCSDRRALRKDPAGIWSGIYNREFLINNNVFKNETPGASYQDISFAFLSRINAERAWIMDEAFYEYRKDNSNSSTNDPKRMNAITVEYDLLEKRLKESEKWNDYKEYYALLRLWGTTWFYRILDDDGKKIYLPKVQEEIMSLLKRNEFTFEMYGENEKSIIEASKKSLEDLIDAIIPVKISNSDLNEFEDSIDRIQDKNRIVIFGAGKLGERLWLFLAERGIFAVAFSDNDVSRWGTEYCNTRVRSPEDIFSNLKDCFWIIANLKNGRDIKEQLITMGIDTEKILICPGNSILKKMYPYERG